MNGPVPVATLSRPRRRARFGATAQERLAYRLLFPVIGLVFLIVMLPFIVAVATSLRAGGDGAFVGAQNYARALTDPLLIDSLRATGTYALLVLPTQLVVGTALALLVHHRVKSPRVRALIYVLAIVPIVIPPVGAGVIARLIYAPDYGVLNHLLQLAGIIQQEIPWLSSPASAMVSVASVDVWQWTPFVYLVMFAGLQTVPHETIEAAQVDGASWWQQFWRIELDYLRPLLLLVLFLRLADTLRVFDHIFVLTGGGPGTATQLLSLHLYRVGFKFFNTGEAAALAILVMVGVSLLYTAVARLLPLERD
jgi:multiple sugar transport system permease protein